MSAALDHASAALPHWETTPEDLKAATREIKAAIRARIEASGRTVEEVWSRRRGAADRAGGGDRGGQGARRDDLAGDRLRRHRGRHGLPGGARAPAPSRLRRHPRPLRARAGARLGPGHRRLRRAQRASSRTTAGRATTSSAASARARRSTPSTGRRRRWRRARATAWRASSRSSTTSGRTSPSGTQWFDPDRDSLYPDRIRRRPPGANSGGLGAHLDPGTLDLWMTSAYQQAFRHLFDGSVEQYDPWDASYRTAGPQYPGTTMCSVFRTFQGWTALSDMAHDQGVLHTVPIPEAMAYLMLRPLLSDVRRRRHVRHHRQPGLPRHRAVAPAARCAPSPASRTSRPATPSGGTAT